MSLGKQDSHEHKIKKKPVSFQSAILMGFIIGFSFLLPITSFASDRTQHSSTQQWQFDPNIGYEGAASIETDNASRFTVDCGNGGAPGLTLHHPSIPILPQETLEQRVPLILKIDDQDFEQIFSCYSGELVCVSFGFPSVELMRVMQNGSKMAIYYHEDLIETFSLARSKVTISRLTECLGPNRADWRE